MIDLINVHIFPSNMSRKIGFYIEYKFVRSLDNDCFLMSRELRIVDSQSPDLKYIAKDHYQSVDRIICENELHDPKATLGADLFEILRELATKISLGKHDRKISLGRNDPMIVNTFGHRLYIGVELNNQKKFEERFSMYKDERFNVSLIRCHHLGEYQLST